MPLVAHNKLPTFARLREQGHEVLSLERAQHQDIRELHIGFLNMMPDAALAATEQQFIRLVGSSNPIAQFYVYPFSLPELNRGQDAESHIRDHYFSFGELQERGLDALIITGANVANPSLDHEAFWTPLMDVVRWAESNVTSVLCSCLATHALVNYFHGIRREPLDSKRWGVYNHYVRQPEHPLMRDINTRFDAPHSRFNAVTREQLEQAGLTVLVDSEDAGVHLAVSPDQFRIVYFQGHPEYDAVSLMKEFKRELNRFHIGELDAPPPYPEYYFSVAGLRILDRHVDQCIQAKAAATAPPEFPESALLGHIHNTWGDTAKAIVNNWLGLVYKLTNLDRKLQYMEGVDPHDPLQLRDRIRSSVS
jgi:homoserine O-succinyltransferase